MAEQKDAKPSCRMRRTARNPGIWYLGVASRKLVIAFVGVVILMETAMFFFLVPSAEEVSALAEAKADPARSSKAKQEAETQASDENKVRRSSNWECTARPSARSIPNERSAVELDLYGLVRKKDVR